MDQAAAWTTPVVTTTGFFILYPTSSFYNPLIAKTVRL
jgi:hypothetical protein